MQAKRNSEIRADRDFRRTMIWVCGIVAVAASVDSVLKMMGC